MSNCYILDGAVKCLHNSFYSSLIAKMRRLKKKKSFSVLSVSHFGTIVQPMSFPRNTSGVPAVLGRMCIGLPGSGLTWSLVFSFFVIDWNTEYWLPNTSSVFLLSSKQGQAFQLLACTVQVILQVSIPYRLGIFYYRPCFFWGWRGRGKAVTSKWELIDGSFI